MRTPVEARSASAHPCARVTKHNNVRWPTEREERLKELAAQNNMSAKQIGDELGYNRSAVLGKLKRLGISIAKPQTCKDPRPRARRGNVPSRAPAQRAARPPTAAVQRWKKLVEAAQVELDKLEEVAEARPETAIASVLELHAGVCRYPIGDPRHPDFCFCGSEAFAPFPYCAGHARLSYRPARER